MKTEKIIERALQKALDYLHENITASVVYEDFHDFSQGIKGVEVDYFPETASELISEMGIKGEDFSSEETELEQLISSDLFDVLKSVTEWHGYIEAPLKRVRQYGIDSQNVMKILDYPGISSEQRATLHKLIFACEGLVNDTNFKKLEKMRVDLVCSKYRNVKAIKI